MSRTVLLTGGRIPSALELARALAGMGAKVYMADSYPIFLGQASRAVRASFVVPSPRKNLNAYRQAILRIVRDHGIDCVLPCSEEVLYLATFKLELSAYAEVFCAAPELLLALHHKQRFVEYARSWGLSVPASSSYHGEPLNWLPAFCEQPYVLKKVYSRAGSAVKWGAAGQSPASLNVPPDGSWLLQEKLIGRPLCSFSVIKGGEVLLSRLYSPGSALGTVSVSFEAEEEARIDAWIERFARVSGYEGFVSFDFIVARDTVWAIECNPRLTSGIHLCDAQQLAAAALFGARAEAAHAPRRRAQFFLALLAALPQALPQKAFWPQLPRLLRSPDVVASWRDPIPFLYQWICVLYFVKQMLRGNMALAACSMDGIEWDEDQPLPGALNSV